MPDPGGQTDLIGRALGRWAEGARRHALWVVILAAGVTLGLGRYVATHLGIDTDTENMLSRRLPWRQDYIRYTAAFPLYADQILVVLDGATPELAGRVADRLTRKLRADTIHFKGVFVPGGGAFFDRNGLLYASVEELGNLDTQVEAIEPLLEELGRDPTLPTLVTVLGDAMQAVRYGADLDLAPMLGRMADALAASRQGRFYELSWEDALLSGSGSASKRRRFLVIRPRMNFDSLLPGAAAVEAVRTAAADLDIGPSHGVRFRVSGSVPMLDDELRSVKRGAGLAGLLALLTVSVVLYLGLRSWRLMAASLLTLVAGLVGTSAFAALAVGHLNLISVAFAVLYIGLGIDYAIHMSLRYRELVVREGRRHVEAVRVAATDVGSSLFLSAATTSVCFYAFIPTSYRGLSELGIISGTGMFIGLFTTLTLLPALLELMPLAPRIGPIERDPTSLQIARAAARHGRPLAIAALVVGAGAALLLPRSRFDYDPLDLRDPNSESVSTYRELLASDDSPATIELLAPDSAAAAALSARLETLSTVRQVRTLADFVPADQERKLALIAETRTDLEPLAPFPDSVRHVEPARGARAIADLRTALARFRPYADSHQALAATHLLDEVRRWRHAYRLRSPEREKEMVWRLEESLLSALPGSVERLRTALAAEPITARTLPRDLVERWKSADGAYRMEVAPANSVDANALRRFVEQVRRLAPHATGTPVINIEAGDAVVHAFQTALLAALVATILLLLGVLRSVAATVVVLVPLLLAGVLTGAAAVLLHLPFNFANVIALPLLLGVGVDNGIHMVHRARQSPGADGNVLATSTARAVLFSTLTTIASFGNLALSPHRGMASMGKLLTIGMMATLVCTLLVLPGLLSRRAGAEASG